VQGDNPDVEQADTLLRLNPEQRRAATYTGGPLLVVAGPGSGKTRVIAHRIGYRIRETHLMPRSMVAITFTHRAAAELRTRVDALTGEGLQVRVGTFHWMCNGLLRRHVGRIGYRPGFRLLGAREARVALRTALDRCGGRLPLPTAANAISAWKNGSSASIQAKKHQIPEGDLRAVAAAYRKELRAEGSLDLDDLLVESVRLLHDHEDVRKRYNLAIAELLVDEYQDTNPVQQQLLRLLAPHDGSIVVVGDEDQAIYSWRQAGSGTVGRFLQDFPDAQVITLDETYRSTKHILRAATSLIAQNRSPIEKRLRTANQAGERPICYVARDEKDEGSWIAGEIRARAERERGAWSEFAVLYRTNAQSRAIEDALVRAHVPYRILSGRSFYRREEIRAVVAHLRLAVDLADDSAAGFLLDRVRGIGSSRARAVRDAAARGRRPLSAVFLDGAQDLPIPADGRERLRAVGERVMRVASLRQSAPVQVAEEAIAAVREGLDCDLDYVDDDRREELEEFRTIVGELGERTTLRQMVERLSLQPGADETLEMVSLMTLHAAKGLEFPVAFLAGLEEGLLPHRRALEAMEDVEEERRLCYVGLTRAQRMLYFSYAHVRSVGGNRVRRTPSRFLAEIGQANVDTRFAGGRRRPLRLSVFDDAENARHPSGKRHHGDTG
jgi:DNA helicase-2/ATP-dependent DNA helicase PcrA